MSLPSHNPWRLFGNIYETLSREVWFGGVRDPALASREGFGPLFCSPIRQVLSVLLICFENFIKRFPTTSRVRVPGQYSQIRPHLEGGGGHNSGTQSRLSEGARIPEKKTILGGGYFFGPRPGKHRPPCLSWHSGALRNPIPGRWSNPACARVTEAAPASGSLCALFDPNVMGWFSPWASLPHAQDACVPGRKGPPCSSAQAPPTGGSSSMSHSMTSKRATQFSSSGTPA